MSKAWLFWAIVAVVIYVLIFTAVCVADKRGII